MQFVRVLTQDYEFSMRRKIKELFLASLVNETIPKNLIPVIYLHNAYYGTGMIGIEQVFERLKINRNTDKIEIAASIIARIKYPQSNKESRTSTCLLRKRTNHIMQLYSKHSNSNVYSSL